MFEAVLFIPAGETFSLTKQETPTKRYIALLKAVFFYILKAIQSYTTLPCYLVPPAVLQQWAKV